MERQKATRTAQPPKSKHVEQSAPDESANPEFEGFGDLARKLLKVSKQELDEKRNGGAPA